MSSLSEAQLREIIADTRKRREARGYAWPEGAEERIYSACATVERGRPVIKALEQAIKAEENVSA